MEQIHIVTNYHRRPVLDGCDLTEAERAKFDYIDWEAVEGGSDSASFVRYRGELYDLHEFELSPESLAGWHAVLSDSYFSGVAIRYVYDEYGEYDIIVAYIHW